MSEPEASSGTRTMGALYNVAFSALLCIVNTYVSIAVTVLAQLNYVFAPRFRPLYRL